jgi:hypothetical protein
MDAIAAFANYDRNTRYGVRETGNIAEFTDDLGRWPREELSDRTVTLDDPELVTITRLRLIGACSEYPYWDLSNCFGQLTDGTNVRVDLGVRQFGRYSYKRELVTLAKRAGRFGKDMGLLDNISTLEG